MLVEIISRMPYCCFTRGGMVRRNARVTGGRTVRRNAAKGNELKDRIHACRKASRWDRMRGGGDRPSSRQSETGQNKGLDEFPPIDRVYVAGPSDLPLLRSCSSSATSSAKLVVKLLAALALLKGKPREFPSPLRICSRLNETTNQCGRGERPEPLSSTHC